MGRPLTTDLCIIGAGSGGLSVAAGAAQMGASTVLIERDRMGGDCLNAGCVPSKALLAAGHAAHATATASAFGVDLALTAVDGSRVHDHVADVIAAIAPNDSVERFEGLGVRVLKATARFLDPDTVEAGGERIRARRFVIATGSSPAVPPVSGLADTPYLTNETVFAKSDIPAHLIIIGGGPIGMEMAQAHRRLGSRVTVLEMAAVLPRDEPDLVQILRRQFADEGIDIREGVSVTAVAPDADGVRVQFRANGGTSALTGSHLLIATGRRPQVQDLDLERAGVAYTAKGIQVDNRLRTSNRRIFAIGDVIGSYPFTHVASYHAGIVLKNALFRLPARVDTRALPWVTYTQPELAHVGLSEAEARERHGPSIRVLTWPYHDNDRAHTERLTQGLAKVVTTKRGRILGASILGAAAGELIQVWVLAMSQNLKIGSIATMVAPYPTLGEINKRAAGSFYTPKLFSNRTRCLVRLLTRLG